MFKPAVIFAITIAFITLAAQHLRQVEVQFSQQLLQGEEQAETSHVFTEISLRNTDENGYTKSIVTSPYTRYVLSLQQTHLETPHMLVYRKQQSPVKLTAKSAVIDHKLNTTTLRDDVKVSIDENKNNPLRMTSDSLLIDNTRRIATTQSAASIFYGSSRMQGVGMEFDLDKKQIKFLDKVHGVYER